MPDSPRVWVSPPGDTLMDLLEERGIPAKEAAQQLGISLPDLGQGDLPITPELAQALAGLGSTPEFWIRREANYRKQRGLLAGRVAEHKTELIRHNGGRPKWLGVRCTCGWRDGGPGDRKDFLERRARAHLAASNPPPPEEVP